MDNGALCTECPLFRQQSCPPEPATSGRAKLVTLGEGPGKTEAVRGRPFVGVSGGLHNECLEKLGYDRTSEVHVTNATLCLPLKHMSKADWAKAVACCRPRLVGELAAVPARTSVVVLGKRALQSVQMGSKATVRAWRGWFVECVHPELLQELHYIPTFHPAFILREIWNKPFLDKDFHRAAVMSGRERDDIPSYLEPGVWGPRIVDDVPALEEALEQIRERGIKGAPVSVDVENASDEHPLVAPLRCFGLGTAGLSVALRFSPIPPHFESLRIGQLAKEIYQHPDIVKVLQNMNHDRLSIWARTGWEIDGPVEDTLPAGCVLSSQTAHDLGTMHSWYYMQERWKTKFHSGDDKKGASLFAKSPWPELAKYNCGDTQGTAQVWVKQKPRLATLPRGEELYAQSMQLGHLAYKMTKRGVKLNQARQEEHHTMLQRKKEAEHAAFIDLMKAEVKMPSGWNLNMKPGKWWLNKQKEGPKQLFYDVLGIECKHFSQETGEPSLSKNALRDIIGSKNPTASMLARRMFMFNRWDKLDDYTRMDSVGDTIHPMWSAGLKKTRRWGSSPNMQNIPYDIWEKYTPEDDSHKRMVATGSPRREGKKGQEILTRPGMRDMLVARKNMWLVGADYSQLELRNLGLLAKDEILLDAYATGKDVHDVNTRDLFKAENAPKHLRRLAKNFVYGVNYGADWHTVYLNLLPEFPGLDPRLIEHLYEEWFRLHPWIVEWQAKQWSDGRRLGYTISPLSGHKFYHYWGRVKPTVCYNFPIQGMAADMLNKAILLVDADLRPEDGEYVLLNVHDEIVLEGPDPVRLAGILKRRMEMDITIDGHTMHYPIDAWKAKNWGHTEAM
jgi:uracil-DNA glycosylase family 4